MKNGLSTRPLQPEDLPTVSALAIASKASWGYDTGQMEIFTEELTLSTDALEALTEAQVACVGDEIVGFFTLHKHPDGTLELDHLFVAEKRFRQGVGSYLMERAIERSRAMRKPKLTIIADPNAAGFYEKFGARKVGAHQSRIPNRTIPIYELDTRPR